MERLEREGGGKRGEGGREIRGEKEGGGKRGREREGGGKSCTIAA